MNDYIYDKQYILAKSGSLKKSIRLSQQYIQGLRPHFSTQDKPSHISAQFTLTEHDYDNLQYIAQHRDTLHMLIKKYSSLGIQYPAFSYDDIHDIPSMFSLDCTVDFTTQSFVINTKDLSSSEQFVLLYLQTLELIQICIDIYNEFERVGKQLPLIPLKNGVAFVSNNRSLIHLPTVVDPRSWNALI